MEIRTLNPLVGIGVYTPSEASKLLEIPAGRISRWLRGHTVKGRSYPRLWKPEIDLGNEKVILGFRDLMEARVADAFIKEGISPQRVRSAIEIARGVIGNDHPLSTNNFRTDGREIFLQVIENDEKGLEKKRLLNIFKRQYEFNGIIEPILKTVDFDRAGEPQKWWPRGRQQHIVLDPTRCFGQPIDSVSGVPTAILAAAEMQEGTKGAALAYEVSEAAVRRAVTFENEIRRRPAA